MVVVVARRKYRVRVSSRPSDHSHDNSLPHPIPMSPMNDTTNQPASGIDIDLLTYDGVL